MACAKTWTSLASATLRHAESDDAAALAAIYEPHVTRAITSFELVAPSAEEMRARLSKIREHAPWLVCESAGEVVGYAYASAHRERAAYRWSLDNAVYVRQGRQRQGIGRALSATLFELARFQGYYAVHAGITLPNPSSVALHEALGFKPIGTYHKVGYKLGAWRDVGWWQLELCARSGEPAPPLSPREAQVEHPQEWEAAFVRGQELLRNRLG